MITPRQANQAIKHGDPIRIQELDWLGGATYTVRVTGKPEGRAARWYILVELNSWMGVIQAEIDRSNFDIINPNQDGS